MKRRDFLLTSLGGLALSSLFSCGHRAITGQLPSTGNELAAFWHGVRRAGPYELEDALSSHVIFLDPVRRSYEACPLPISFHSILQSESDPNLLYLFSKWNLHIGVYRRDLRKLVTTFESPRHRSVFGHAVWDRAQRGFWYSENDTRERRGYVVLRDLNFKELLRLDTGGSEPHEIQWGPDGQLLVANTFNGKSLAPGLAYLDVNRGKLMDYVEVPELHNVGGLTHFAQSQTDKRIFLGGIKKQLPGSHVVVIDEKRKSRVLPLKREDFVGESLSVTHDVKNDHLLWVNPAAGAFFRWDLKQDKLIEVNSSNHFIGLHHWGSNWLCTTKTNSTLGFLKSGEVQDFIKVKPPVSDRSWGVHMFTLSS